MSNNFTIIDPKAKIGQGVEIGPFTTIEGDVEIGDGTWIGPNVTIMNGARIGRNCRIFPGTSVEQVRIKLAQLVADPQIKVTTLEKRSEVPKAPPPLTPEVMEPVKAAAAKIKIDAFTNSASPSAIVLSSVAQRTASLRPSVFCSKARVCTMDECR